jgi:hypothetical protein
MSGPRSDPASGASHYGPDGWQWLLHHCYTTHRYALSVLTTIAFGTVN